MGLDAQRTMQILARYRIELLLLAYAACTVPLGDPAVSRAALVIAMMLAASALAFATWRAEAGGRVVKPTSGGHAWPLLAMGMVLATGFAFVRPGESLIPLATGAASVLAYRAAQWMQQFPRGRSAR